jgi:hypothetical protein
MARLGIPVPLSTFGASVVRGAGALEDGQSEPRRVWNKNPSSVAEAVLELALKTARAVPARATSLIPFTCAAEIFECFSLLGMFLKFPR